MLLSAAAAAQSPQPFKTVVYIPAQVVMHMKDRAWLESSWAAINGQVHVDKVYIETYRSRQMVDAQLIEEVKKFFTDRHVEVAGGICFSDDDNGQFVSFTYTKPADRDYVKKVSEFAARHFDEIILDDFFFANTKAASDIDAKGSASWTDFRLKTMDEVSRDLVVGAARAVNPKVKMIIKFPNWYEHFQGNGYDLAREPKIFDGIYAGTETRDPTTTDQDLQQYESYEILRYFDNISPGRNGGGWVDTFDIRYIDRYSEQLWLTIFGKAREMTLFNWNNLLDAAKPGARPWQTLKTGIQWERVSARAKGKPVTFATVAGDALDQVRPFAAKLGKPVGISSYRPAHAVGEDFLHEFLGMSGIPIELYDQYPKEAPVVLLTESAAADAQIVAEMKDSLRAGKTVIITSGLLRALSGKGMGDIIELRDTDAKAQITSFIGAFGPGAGTDLGQPEHPLLMPEVRFLTNDAWPVVRGIANNNAFPVLLMDRYGAGTLFVLTIPDNFTDLYALPAPALDALRSYIAGSLPVRIEGPSRVALFEYANGTFVLESFRDKPCDVTVLTSPAVASIANLQTGEKLSGTARKAEARGQSHVEGARTAFKLQVPPHTFMAFSEGAQQ